jgi:arylsulfatase A-like enzyme
MSTLSRRHFLPSLASPLALAQRNRPNVLMIMADDLGRECLSCYGGLSYRTPKLDRMASQGVRFTHAYAQPLCTPTRVQLMTGKWNFRNWQAFGIMNPAEKTFGHMMQQAGYRTAVAGKWQLWSYNPPAFMPEWRGRGIKPDQAGFDEHCTWHTGHTEDKGSRYGKPVITQDGALLKGMEDRYGEDIFAEYLERFMARKSEKPFFAYWPMALTHDPFNPTPWSPDWKTGDRLKADKRYFADMVEYMDHRVGQMLEFLNRNGLAENTLVLFYADNGTHWTIDSRFRDALGERTFRGGKRDTNDNGMHVPLIAHWKGISASGTTVDHLIDSTDFLPTIAEAAGASTKVIGQVDGRSFLPQIKGQRGNAKPWLYSWYDPKPGVTQMEFERKIFAWDHHWKLYSDGRLYRIDQDPEEKNPVSTATAEAAAARRKLRAAIDSVPAPRA